VTSSPTSPFAPAAPVDDDSRDTVLSVTDAARAKLIELRDEEPEGNRLGLRLAIIADTGRDFTYDLSFDVVTTADVTDVVERHDGLKVIIPAKDVPNLRGATLDHELDGLVLRNPNRPRPVEIGNLTIDDELAAQVEAVVSGEVNPALDVHGGFVTFVGHDGEGRVFLTMGGGCHGCSMSRMTMLQGVQKMLIDSVPGVTQVIDATDHSTGENPYYS
jgi:Fe/S biogenesis protein NfuA